MRMEIGERVLRRRELAIAVGMLMMASCGVAQTVAWTASWASAQARDVSPRIPAGKSTYRNVVRVSLGGASVRVRVTNEFGRAPLVVSAASIEAQPLMFGGKASVVVPAAKVVFSDAVMMKVTPLQSVTVSVTLPESVVEKTCHALASSRNAVVPLSGGEAVVTRSWCFVDEVDVAAQAGDAVVAAFGDSITDGKNSTLDANRRWPDVLAERLSTTARTAVIDVGISGNRLLHDGLGPAGLQRFDGDVVARTGVKYVVLLEGINDIRSGAGAAGLIAAWETLIAKAHARGLKIYGGTLTPFEGAEKYSAAGEQARQGLNAWIREKHGLDGVIDFDAVVRDAQSTGKMQARFDSGDHIHPNDAGYKAMGEAVPLDFFRR